MSKYAWLFVLTFVVFFSPADAQDKPPVDHERYLKRMITAHWNAVTGQVVTIAYDGIGIYDRNFQLLHFKPHPNPNTIVYAYWNPDGSKLIAGGTEIWDAINLQPLVTIDSPTSVSQFNRDGSLIAGVGTDSKSIIIYDTSTGHFVRELSTGDNWIEYAAWSPDNTRFAIQIGRTSIGIVDAMNGGIIQKFQQPHDISSFLWSPDGQYIVYTSIDSVSPDTPGSIPTTGSSTGALLYSTNIINASNGQLIRTFDGQPTLMTNIVWNTSSSELTTISSVGVIYVWNISTGGLLDSFRVQGALVNAAYSRFGARLLLAVNSDVVYNVDIPMTPLSSISEKFLGGTFQVVVPNPSIEKLEALIGQCVLDSVADRSLQTSLAAHEFQAFIEQVELLADSQFIQDCKADLITLADALQVSYKNIGT